jgi:uncharacterized protein with PQ loop repeat
MNNTIIDTVNNTENNNNIVTSVLGVIGTVLTTSIYTPQICKSYKEKKVEISWIMLSLELTSDIIWISYYYLNEIYYPILTSSLIFTFASTLGVMKYYFM